MLLDFLRSKKVKRQRLKRRMEELEESLIEAYRSLEMSRLKCHRLLHNDFYGPILSSFREKKISLEYHIVVMDEILKLEKRLKEVKQELYK